jgi:hypothetical protein
MQMPCRACCVLCVSWQLPSPDRVWSGTVLLVPASSRLTIHAQFFKDGILLLLSCSRILVTKLQSPNAFHSSL